MPKEIILERMTWPKVGKAIEEGYDTAVFACGATEQHGLHLPLFVDAEHGERMALVVARRLGKALVAPSIRVGCSEHHMTFPGTISILPETLEALVRDYCVSLSRHGFRNICIIPTHGGNFAPIASMLDRLREAVGPGTRVFAFTDLGGMMKAWRKAVQEESGLGDRVGGHADIAESSIMMVLHPELVDKDIAEPGFTDPVTPEVLDRMFKEGLQNLTPNGVMGDPRGMSAPNGLRCIDTLAGLISDFFAGQIREVTEDPC